MCFLCRFGWLDLVKHFPDDIFLFCRKILTNIFILLLKAYKLRFNDLGSKRIRCCSQITLTKLTFLGHLPSCKRSFWTTPYTKFQSLPYLLYQVFINTYLYICTSNAQEYLWCIFLSFAFSSKPMCLKNENIHNMTEHSLLKPVAIEW